MTISTRDKRATIYPYVGRSDGGFVSSTYGVARGTYWARLSPIPGEESMLDGQSGITARAVIELADEVPVAENDLIVIDDIQWKAGPITPRRSQRAIVLRVDRSNEMAVLPTDQAAAAAEEVFGESGHTDSAFDAPADASIDGGGAATTVFADTLDGGGA